MSRKARAVAVCLACLSSGSAALAANTSTLDAVASGATIHSVGLVASLTGDDNGNAVVKMQWQKAGDAFKPGHALLRVDAMRAIGSAMFLEPATDYVIKVVLEDPDNAAPVEVAANVRTRDDVPAASTGTSLYVSAATGLDTNAGTQAAPFKTIGAAVKAAGAGTTIHVGAGVYREGVTVDGTHGGAAGNPMRIVGDQGAVIDGSDAALEDGSAFQDAGGGVWSAPFTGASLYAAFDDTRLYDYAALADLQSGAAGLAGGFFVDQAASRIYVKLPDGSTPSQHTIHVAKLDVGVLLDTVTDVVVEGLEIRYFGAAQYSSVGVDVRDTSRAWIRGNMIHHLNEGVRIRRPMSSNNVVENNSVRDTSVFGWPWDAVKAHTPEASAISVTDGTGNIVRRNQTDGTFNGIYVGSFDGPSEAIAANTDIYENQLRNHGDDGFEPEGACVNVRFWNNSIRGVYNGISLAPISVGPLFVVRTLVEGYKAHALKVNNGPTGWMLVYHTTTVPSALPEAQAMAPSLPFSHLVMRNNVWSAHRYVFESSVTPSGPIDLDYDNLYTDSLDGTARFVKWLDVRYASLADLRVSGTIEPHGFGVVPAYEDPASGNYTPAAGSGLLDVGQVIEGINDRFFVGAGPDLGAVERGGVAPAVDGGMPEGGSAGAGGGAGSAGAGGAIAGAGAGGAPAAENPPGDSGGCACTTSRPGSALGAGAAIALLALAMDSRRRGARRIS
jgi:hypothetical protein